MKTLSLLVLSILLSPIATAQTPASLPTNFYGIGASYNGSASPEGAGTALYGRLLSQSSGTYAATVLDILPVSTKPFTVDTSIGAGIVQKAFCAKLCFWVPTTAGLTVNGKNMGWHYDFGVMVPFKLYDNLGLALVVRGQKSSISDGSGIQPIIGVLATWGK